VTADPHRVTVERCPPEHVGLGVGTALGLAVAKAIHPELSAVELAPVVGRGERSGVGLHGFDRGGLIVDGGKELPGELPRLAGRYDFPADWRIVLAIPPRAGRWAGDRERAAFDRPRSPNEGRIAERMERLLAGEMLPGLRGGDGARFGAALHEYNRLAGLPFVADQGGVYVSWEVAELIAAVRTLGVAGVGQSSWGPAVFAVVPDPDRAAEVVREVRHRFGTLAVDVARAALAGAVMSA
jgi:beta-RFAP synthase